MFDSSGRIVARALILGVSKFSEGLAVYETQGKPSIRGFDLRNFVYRDFPGLKGFIDRTGRVAIDPTFAEVGSFVDGLSRAVLDGYCHIAILDGGQQGTPTTGYPTDCGGAPADAVSPCKVGFIDRTGVFAIQPHFESAQDFQEDVAAVRVGGLWDSLIRVAALSLRRITSRFDHFARG